MKSAFRSELDACRTGDKSFRIAFIGRSLWLEKTSQHDCNQVTLYNTLNGECVELNISDISLDLVIAALEELRKYERPKE